jgi:hypothetical protein
VKRKRRNPDQNLQERKRRKEKRKKERPTDLKKDAEHNFAERG